MSLSLIAHYITEFLLVVLPHSQPLPPNGVSVAATVVAGRPTRGPYVGYWGPSVPFLAVQWFNMEWNHHRVLACGALFHFKVILDVLTIV